MLLRLMLVAVPLVAVPLVVVLAGCGSGKEERGGSATVVSAAAGVGPAGVAARPRPAADRERLRTAVETACLQATREQVAVGRKTFSPAATDGDAFAYAKTSRKAWRACATLTVAQARAIREEVDAAASDQSARRR